MERLLYYKRYFCDVCGNDTKRQYKFNMPYKFEYPGHNNKIYCRLFCLCEDCAMELSKGLMEKIDSNIKNTEDIIANKCKELDNHMIQTTNDIDVIEHVNSKSKE